MDRTENRRSAWRLALSAAAAVCAACAWWLAPAEALEEWQIPAEQLTPEELLVTGRLTYHDLVARSEQIYEGTVVQLSSYEGLDGRAIFTDVTLEVSDGILGPTRDRVTFTIEGGRIGSERLWVSGAPEFCLGEQAVVLLREYPVRGVFEQGALVVANRWLGRFAVDRASQEGRAQADVLVSHLRDIAEGRDVDTARYGHLCGAAATVTPADPQHRAKVLTSPTVTLVDSYKDSAAYFRWPYMDSQSQGELLRDTLRIHGTSFGDGSGDCQQWVTYTGWQNGSDFNRTRRYNCSGSQVDAQYFISWSDSLIEMKFPWVPIDTVTTGTLSVTTVIGGTSYTSNGYAYDLLWKALENDFWTDTHAEDIDFRFVQAINADSLVDTVMCDTFPIGLYEVDTTLAAALQVWEDVEYSKIGFDLAMVDTLGSGGTAAGLVNAFDGINHMVFVADDGAWGAKADVKAVADTITDVDIEFNYRKPDGSTRYWTVQSDTNTAPYKCLKEVAVHEIGHGLGLRDLYGGGDSEKTMYYSSLYDPKRATLSPAEEDFATWVHYHASPKGLRPEQSQALRPNQLALVQNYPNPFNPHTLIRFYLPEGADNSSVLVFNELGQQVRALVVGTRLKAGEHTVMWDGRSDAGTEVSSGLYICRVRSGATRLSQKMTLLR